MQPFDILGLPDPDECLGIVGVLLSVLVAVAAFTWFVVFEGGIPAFLILAISVVLGISSFMYCTVWVQSPETSVGSS